MNSEIIKKELIERIERYTEDRNYYKKRYEGSENYLYTINYYEGLVNGYKDALELLNRK